MSDVVERAKALLEGVTEGPWVWERSTLTGGIGGYDEVLTPGPVECMSYCYGGTSVIESDNPEHDREFIAASRQLVPELVAEVERLRNEVNRLQYESCPERGVEEYLALRYADDPVEAFNLFIRAWVPEHYHAHLLDDDENDGEFVRDHIRRGMGVER